MGKRKRKKKKERKFFSGPAVMRGFFIALVFVVFASFALHQVSTIDQDLGRHLKTAQVIWQTKHIPDAGAFSFAEPMSPRPENNWLAQLAFLGVYKLSGFTGLEILEAVLLVLSFGLAFGLAWKKRYFIFSLLASLFCAALVLARSEVRPEIFGILCFSLFLFVLAKNRDEIRWHFWTLPALGLFWVNLDSSFWLGGFLLFFFLLDRIWARRKEVHLAARKHKIESFIFKAGIVLILHCALSLVNPAGWRGLFYPFLAKGEAVAASFLGVSFIWWTVLVALILLFVFNFKRFGFFSAVLALILSILVWFNPKYLPFFGLAILPVLTRNFGVIREKYGKYLVKWEISRARLLFRLLTISLVFVILIGSVYVAFSPRLSEKIGKEPFGFSAKTADARAAVDFLKENQISGRIFNSSSVGDYLIWRLYPDQVFTDGSSQNYWPQFAQIYRQMTSNSESWKQYSREYKLDIAVWDNANRQSLFARIILDDPAWEMVYLDENFSVWLKKSEHEELVQRFGLDEQRLAERAESLISSAGFQGLENLGYFFQAIGKNDLTIKAFERALERKPSKEMAFELGKLFVKAEANAKAIQAFRRSVSLDERFVQAYIALGECYYQDGDFSEARKSWEKVLEIDSENREAKFYLENMGLIPFKK